MSLENDINIIAKCPVCGIGNIIEVPRGFYCDNQWLPGGKCGFRIFRRMHGISLMTSHVVQLIAEGKTDEMRMVNLNGQPFVARFIINDGKVDIALRYHYLKGRCPVCGGRVLKTGRGWACEYSVIQKPLCRFHVTGVIHGRKISDSEMENLLDGCPGVLDGFSTVDGRFFSSVLCVRDNGEVGLDPCITTCPSCGGNILVSPLAYNCSNYKNPDIHCKFTIWRNIGGHQISAEEMRQICEEGSTREQLEMFKDNGMVYFQKLALSADKSKIIKI